ncbi:hypothetical protein FGG08_000200 [Glutinoglossum americanum]|uniref:Heterokaryon incompatibility domain-containing protein n=1 Tax=Glutinoglossum americanum TaxID=1670608 RepID=A0A9P8L717_9PEZI|nr:hypothetical protein FGG08_000200 [Glutinoglossum americanum]
MDPVLDRLLYFGEQLMIQKYAPPPYAPLDSNDGMGELTVRFQKVDWVAEILTRLGIHCPVCFSVSGDLAVFSRPRNGGRDRDSKAFIKWAFRLEDLANAAAAGCQFCGFMANRFFDDRGYTFFWGIDSSTQNVTCCSNAPRTAVSEKLLGSIARIRKFLEKHPDADFTLLAQPTDYGTWGLGYGRIHFKATSTSLNPDAVKEILGCRQRIVLELYAHKGAVTIYQTELIKHADMARIDDPAAKFIQGRPENIYPSSDESIQQAQDWIDDCINNHRGCSKPTPSPLPTRIIKLLDGDGLKLSDDEERGQYATLSYCWGGPQTFCTTVGNLEDRKRGFRLSDLPQTLQDAVYLTRRLGLSFLWIDSICILQDSETDKEREILEMAKYYKQSYVTICAASAASCHDGFLQARKNECQKHPGFGLASDLLKLPFISPDAEIGTVLFREESPYYLNREPIADRAWTLQERLLSPRVLMYGRRLVWLCHCAQNSHGGLEDWSYDNQSFDHRELRFHLVEANKTSSMEEKRERAENLYTVWHGAVREFSNRKMTIPDDKLPAIGALAAEISDLASDEYLAGLWRGPLLRELLWSTRLPLKRPPSWRAPSWSWASVDNPVTFERMAPWNAVELASITECSIIAKTPEFPFGQVTAAALEINGPVLELGRDNIVKILRREHSIDRPDDSIHYRRAIESMMLQLGSQDWDPPDNAILLCLFACPTSSGGEGEDCSAVVYGLVLEAKPEGKYERISSFSALPFTDWKCLEDMRKSLKII